MSWGFLAKMNQKALKNDRINRMVCGSNIYNIYFKNNSKKIVS